jgi:hypothetical protein
MHKKRDPERTRTSVPPLWLFNIFKVFVKKMLLPHAPAFVPPQQWEVGGGGGSGALLFAPKALSPLSAKKSNLCPATLAFSKKRCPRNKKARHFGYFVYFLFIP